MALKQVVDADDDPYLAACCAHAVRHAIWIQAGSTPVLMVEANFSIMAQ
jgi:hypothetical protein